MCAARVVWKKRSRQKEDKTKVGDKIESVNATFENVCDLKRI